jgi:hypothetical protein
MFLLTKSFRSVLMLSAIAGMILPCAAQDQQQQVALASSAVSTNKPLPKTWIRVSPRRFDFLVFTRPNEGFTGPFAGVNGRVAGTQDVSLVATQGTVISTDNQLPILHNGAVLVTARSANATLTTRLASITIPAGMTALVECIPSLSIVRVAAVSGSGKEVTANSRKGHQFFSLKAGQEVVFNEKTRDANQQPFEQTGGAQRADVAALLSSPQISGPPLRILGAEASEFRVVGPDTLALRNGQIFMHVPEKIMVQTSVGDAVAGKGAIVDVESDTDYIRLKAFSGPGHTAIVCGDRSIDVSPGQELTVAAHDIEDADLYPPDGIGRRRNEKVVINDKLKAASCDFSITGFFTECPHVQGVKRAIVGEDKNTMDRILKAAAAVQTVTSRYGAYRATTRITRAKRSSPKPRTGGSA